MRTVETQVFKFDELSDDAKEKARQWYRQAGASDEWWDAVYEDFARVCEILGVTLDTKHDGRQLAVYFTGFSSQGDGACFDGSYRYAKGSVKAIKAYAPTDAELHGIALALQQAQSRQFYQLEATTKHRGHYYHSGCMQVEVSHADSLYRDIGDGEDDITGALRGLADWLYNKLETEDDWLNADEQVGDNIRANEYEFTAEGDIA